MLTYRDRTYDSRACLAYTAIDFERVYTKWNCKFFIEEKLRKTSEEAYSMFESKRMQENGQTAKNKI
jgi:hypothetical protein